MNLFSRPARALFDFLFPKPESVLKIESTSPGELLARLPGAEDTGDPHVLAIFAYRHPVVREMIWELKYRGNRLVAGKLAVVLLDVLRQELAERGLSENFSDPLLIPMPASKKRREERGYNQIEILAEEMFKLDDKLFTYLARGLEKHRHTAPQTLTSSREERLENVKSAMRVLDRERVEGRCVIILDDVTTTGGSFLEARRALKEAGARKVLCLAVAH